MNFKDQLDVIVKSFNRPHVLLRLVRSWNIYYPNIPLTICDDSTINMDFSDSAYKNHIIYKLPDEDMGISYGRNYGVAHTSKNFILFLDDDFIIHKETRLDILFELINMRSDIGIVGGVMGKRNTDATIQGGDIYLRNGICYKKCLEDKFETYCGYNFRFCTITDNFFLAKRDIFKIVAWDEKLKTAEHTDFFLQLANTSWKVVFTPEASVGHIHPPSDEISIYDKYRYDRYYYFKEIFWEKYSIKEERYVDSNENVSKLWLTSKVRVDFDNCGKIKPYSSKLKGFILAEYIVINHKECFQIIAIDRQEKNFYPNQIIENDDNFESRQVKVGGVYHNKSLFLLCPR